MRFIPNRNLEAELGRSPELLLVLRAKAEEGARRARAIAPVGDNAPHYRDMITAEAGIDRGVATGRINANKFTSGFVEFGTIHNRAYAVLRRAVESLGLRFQARR